MKTFAFVCWLFLACVFIVSEGVCAHEGREIPLPRGRFFSSTGDLHFVIDTASFRASEGRTYEEIYFLLSSDGLSFSKEEDRYRADFQVRIEVLSPDGKPIEIQAVDGRSDSCLVWRRGLNVSSTEKDRGNTPVLDVFPLILSPGVYQLIVEVIDTNSGAGGFCRGGMSVSAFDEKTLAISDVQFAADIRDATRQGRFVKNRKELHPNVTRSFLQNAPTLHFYFEIYNLSVERSPERGTFDLAYAILDTAGHRLKSYSSRRFRKPGSSCVRADSLDISGLPPDRYILQVVVKDDATGNIITTQRSFQILSSEGPPSLLATDEASLKRYYDQIRYIATDGELKMYKGLSPEGKARFILEFWKKRDPTPDTPENEFAAEHFRRIRYADENLVSLPKKKGSDTDMGRVYIKYGPPDNVERDFYTPTGRSYEIWTYEKYGYYEFVFVDKWSNGVYELVHSTMPGERPNPDWQRDMTVRTPSAPLDRPSDTDEGQDVEDR